MQRRSLSASAAFLELFSAAAWAKIISANFPPALQQRRMKQWAGSYIENQLQSVEQAREIFCQSFGWELVDSEESPLGFFLQHGAKPLIGASMLSRVRYHLR